ncbi:MAG TPA: capsule assembly Wzi family protein, partial [Acidisarcina sp.]
EYEHAPAAEGYSLAVAQQLSTIDGIIPYHPHQDTIPLGPIATVNTFRILDADVSMHLWGQVFSFGKTDEWMGPAQGGSFAWSNNAENIYSFRINKVDPFRIPLLSRITGPFRYDFLVGSLKGHTSPNDPWVHAEKINFKPTPNLEIGFERTVIWGGKGHVPITLHTFLRSFFSFSSPTPMVKASGGDPGARFGSFDLSYRLPYLRNWVTFYTDSEAHDDVSPPSAPRRASYRPGLYLSHFPAMPRLDLRVEAVSTDPATRTTTGGNFMYWETQQPQGYTNKGQIFGDWIGREGKGGQAWLTYHLSPREWVQGAYRNAKVSKDFVPGGTTQNDYTLQVVKRIAPEMEINAWVQAESWKVPLLKPVQQRDVTAAAQFTWYLPKFNH